MGQYHGVGESHYRTTTLHNDVLPRLRGYSFRRNTDRGLFGSIKLPMWTGIDHQRRRNISLMRESCAHRFIDRASFHDSFLSSADSLRTVFENRFEQ